MQIRLVPGDEKHCGWSERSTVKSAKGCTGHYQCWCDRLEAPRAKDWLTEHYC